MANRTYRYFTGDVLYPFGSGLGYTQFQFGRLKVSHESLRAGNDLATGVTVSNRGKRAATAIPEVYLMPLDSSFQPRIALVAFSRVFLEPGESRDVTLSIPAERLAITDQQGRAAIRAGTYRLFVGEGLPEKTQNGSSVLFRILGEKTLKY